MDAQSGQAWAVTLETELLEGGGCPKAECPRTKRAYANRRRHVAWTDGGEWHLKGSAAGEAHVGWVVARHFIRESRRQQRAW
jgi:hypothetical protein